jgi:hypothetical protein
MSTPAAIIQGIVKPDGTLELESKVPLPAGRVQVVVQSVPDLPEGDPFFDMLKDIWAVRAKAGLSPRSEAEIKAVRQRLNDEMEEEIAESMHLQEECQAGRNKVVAPRQEAE